MAFAAQAASALDEITVGYFLEWPMPFQHAKAQGAYDEALGVQVSWVSFESGTAMSAAMASGDVQIAVSQRRLPLSLRSLACSPVPAPGGTPGRRAGHAHVSSTVTLRTVPAPPLFTASMGWARS